MPHHWYLWTDQVKQTRGLSNLKIITNSKLTSSKFFLISSLTSWWACATLPRLAYVRKVLLSKGRSLFRTPSRNPRSNPCSTNWQTLATLCWKRNVDWLLHPPNVNPHTIFLSYYFLILFLQIIILYYYYHCFKHLGLSQILKSSKISKYILACRHPGELILHSVTPKNWDDSLQLLIDQQDHPLRLLLHTHSVSLSLLCHQTSREPLIGPIWW